MTIESTSTRDIKLTTPNLFLKRLTFYLAAPLYFIAGLFFFLKIGEYKFFFDAAETHNYIEGMIGGFASILLIPMFLILADTIAKNRPILGGSVAVFSLIGCMGSFGFMAYFRVLNYDLIQFGFSVEQLELFWQNANNLIAVFLFMGPVFPLAGILTGIGIWLKETIPTWVSILIIAGSVFFPLAQIIGFLALYPLALLLWAIAFPYLGYHLLSK